MRQIWQSRGTTNPIPDSAVQKIIYSIRTNKYYTGFIKFGRMHALPFLFALAFLWVGLTSVSHFFFNIADSFGAFCAGTALESQIAVNKGTVQESAIQFDTASLCAPTGFTVKSGYKYEIIITVTDPWTDWGFSTDPTGYRTAAQSLWDRPGLISGIFLRRVMFRPWFRIIARIGETGVNEYFLDPVKVRISNSTYRASFIAQRSGEVFLYVNDAVIGFPWLTKLFYLNNVGTAKISMKLN